MLNKLMRAVRYYPEQVGLLVFNTGVFAFLWETGRQISDQIGLSAVWKEYIPSPIKALVGEHAANVQGFFSHSAVTWLVGSMVLLAVIRLVKGLLKLVLIGFVLFLGIYLIYRYKETLQEFLS